MNRNELLSSIQADLGANYQANDSVLLGALLDEVINDALFISNRTQLVSDETTKNFQISMLSSEIRRAVKSLYLQRGTEDVTNQSQSGISATYEDTYQKLRQDIVKNGKRILW